MERAIGEIFDFNGAKLQVKDTGKRISCDGCYFDKFEYECSDAHISDYTGLCFGSFGSDSKNVIFVKVEGDNL